MKPIILVKLKMKSIYKNSLSLIGILLIFTLAVGTLYFFYDGAKNLDADVEVNGALSINYENGKKFDVKNNAKIKFTVSNASEKVNYYNINFAKVRGNGTYKLYYNDFIVMEGDLKTTDEIVTDYISIDAHETKMYTLEIINKDVNNLKGTLDIRLQSGKIKTFADTIIENSGVSESPLTKVGDEIAIEDEGLIKNSDDIGVSYYFRGNVLNNYVSFANLLWRIVRINGDGTVRIILDSNTDENTNYYTTGAEDFSYSNSNINTFLGNWFQENLRNYTEYISNNKFCSDITHDDNYNFLASTRILTNKIPTFNCLGTSISSNIGILSIDEVILAGASPNKGNQQFYLYNSSINDSWYTMSGAKGNKNSINMFMVDSRGNITTNVTGNIYKNVRPVINLVKNTEVTGNGTKDNPYHLIDIE